MSSFLDNLVLNHEDVEAEEPSTEDLRDEIPKFVRHDLERGLGRRNPVSIVKM